MFEVFLIIVLGIIGLPILLVALVIGGLAGRRHRAQLDQKLERLSQRVATLETRLDAPNRTAPAAAAAGAAAAKPEPSAAPSVPPVAPASEARAAAPVAGAAAPPPPETGAAGAAGVAARESFEERVMRRWAVWLGAVALALGGVFLVKYSIEQGLFGPTARVVAGGVLGLVLWALADWTRRHGAGSALKAIPRPDAVPPALAAAGAVTLFASVYAAHALYDLVGPLAAFVLLALVAGVTVLLSLLYGAPMAWLGLAGAYGVPALVTTPHPSMSGLLAYTLLATAASTALVRWRGWPWLGWLALAGATGWPALAVIAGGAAELLWPLGLYLIVMPLLFLLLADAVGEGDRAAEHRPVAWLAAGAAAVLMAVLAAIERDNATSVFFMAALAAVVVAVGWRRQSFDRLPWIAAALAVVTLATWQFDPGSFSSASRLDFLVVPPSTEVGSYGALAFLVAAVFAAGGFAALWRAERADRWAIVSAATPLFVLAAAYWRLEAFEVKPPWTALAIVLAVLDLAAVERLAPVSSDARRGLALAAYAVAMVAALSLGMTMSLRLGWLTVALALQLPALAWFQRRIPSPAFEAVARVVATVVLIRLLLNPEIAAYRFDARPVVNGLLYLYGVPAAAFMMAARGFRSSQAGVTLGLLEGGAIALGVALVSLEIRHFSGGGSLTGGRYGLMEQGLQSIAWLSAAYGLMRRSLGIADAVREPAWQILAVLAVINTVLVSCLTSNPLIEPVAVGDLPILDALLPAFGLPALLAALFARALRGRGQESLAEVAAIGGLALGFLYLTLEVRHWFQGAVLAGGKPSDAEWYVYSVAWLAYGAALLALGIARDLAKLRLAGLVIGAVAAVKVFAFDTAALTGLYRAASFLGLGASLVGIAYLYQRLVATPASPTTTGDPP